MKIQLSRIYRIFIEVNNRQTFINVYDNYGTFPTCQNFVSRVVLFRQLMLYLTVCAALQYTPGKYEISRRENRCILKIKNADKDDGAEFKCEVEGDQTSCKVTIEGERVIASHFVYLCLFTFTFFTCFTSYLFEPELCLIRECTVYIGFI